MSRNVYGHYAKRFKVSRNIKVGTYIPYSQYKHEFCPEYVYGGLVIITYSALIKIYFATIKKRNYVWKEDVNLGIICKECNVSVLQIPNTDLILRRKKCVKNERVIAVEIFSIIDAFFCM